MGMVLLKTGCILGELALLAGAGCGGWYALRKGFGSGHIGLCIGWLAAWLIGTLVLAFIGGLLSNLLGEFCGNNRWSEVVAGCWTALLAGGAVYMWCLKPYTAGFIGIRILAVWPLLCCGIWMFLMVGMMGNSSR